MYAIYLSVPLSFLFNCSIIDIMLSKKRIGNTLTIPYLLITKKAYHKNEPYAFTPPCYCSSFWHGALL